MAILIDFSGYMMATAMALGKTEEIGIDLLRHVAISRIIQFKRKLGVNYNKEIVICVDGKDYWRRDYFEYYKRGRAKWRQSSSFDWDSFFVVFNQLKDEFTTELPWKFLEVHRAEADDIISVLSRRLAPHEPVAIVSDDKDFYQLTFIHPNIKQFSPKKSTFNNLKQVSHDMDLFEHIIRGDATDGIPNILSEDDVLVTDGTRQKSIRATKIEEWRQYGINKPDHFCTDTEMLRRFQRNRKLIDLTTIPDEIEVDIVERYEALNPRKHGFFNYLVKNRLTKIIQNGDF